MNRFFSETLSKLRTEKGLSRQELADKMYVTGSKVWILQFIFGILDVLIGCYSFFHPALMAVSLGVLIGIYFVETGFTLMFSGIALRD
ncbi:DUF308 domain-containing protein [Lachnoclostridium sp. MSJ-17]|uniref:DUF308 domain-containing protein n=1 Tax=Lachnoclostridium sp. MSJ-17 TaxID=2841516 RepID=UPI001C0F8721|nr:DUF308 domain-containing protein [Lachnoclostridium sp. MSJ-17]MBU5462318.1 hypothetical protein [Lachnoclostridium sp. MSJ-17]